VFAGTINESGSFEYTVTAQRVTARWRASSTRWKKRRACGHRPSVLWTSLQGLHPCGLCHRAGGCRLAAFAAGRKTGLTWVYKALVLLVIACPCALVISTPVTIVSGLAAAARQGILIKGGVYLEEGRKLKWLALDKTGTIPTASRCRRTLFTRPWKAQSAQPGRQPGQPLGPPGVTRRGAGCQARWRPLHRWRI
jgi:Cd2+/Zn2+-exporting ATPase